MTHDERADEALRGIALKSEPGYRRMRDAITAAIRAAENDALDRAAKAVEDLRFDGHILEAALWKKAILALKHPSN